MFDMIRAGLDEQGTQLGVDQVCLLERHLVAVLRRNSSMNLTAITSADEAIRLHVLDSLEVVRALGILESPVVDIGSGAGYPGLPLAIAGVERITLLDSRKKRAAFLSEIVEELGLTDRVSVQAERAEEHATIYPGAYATAIARAVGALPALVELAAPLLRDGGAFVAMKGNLSESERADGNRAAAVVGLTEERAERYSLAVGGESRTIVVYRRVSDSSVVLPRRPGMAQNHPL